MGATTAVVGFADSAAFFECVKTGFFLIGILIVFYQTCRRQWGSGGPVDGNTDTDCEVSTRQTTTHYRKVDCFCNTGNCNCKAGPAAFAVYLETGKEGGGSDCATIFE